MRPLFYVAPLACVLFPLVSLAARPAVSPARPAAPDLFGKSIRPFMTKHCSSCHNAKASSGGLNLDAFTSAASVDREHHAWELIAQKLRTGEMPPKGLPRPPEAEVKAVTGWISGEFQRLEGQSRPDPGRVTARRLNRAEYNNTVRDLLGVDFRPADDFPQDDSGYGFDNIGDVLSLSPVLMEKYLTAAERVARTALFGPEEMKPTVVQLRPPGRSIRPTAKVPAEYDETGLTLPNTLHVTHRFPVDGEYAFRVVLGGERPGGSEPLQLGFWIDGEKVQERTYDPEGKASFALDRQDLAGQSTDFHVRVPAGDHWLAVSILRMYEGMPASYGGVNPSMRPVPRAPDFTRTLQPPPNATPEQLEAFKMRLERIRQRQREREMEKAAVNVARITFVEVNGPHEQKLGPSPEALKKIYTCGHLNGGHKAWCDRKIVGDLARRAFRRPVTAAEVSRYTRLVAMARVQGDSFEEGVCLAIQGILVSPHFLFRIEKDPTAGSSVAIQPVSAHELASRLSYFLWSSMPDETLLGLADGGRLREPATLAAQVRRMLKDPRSRALVENFGGQWLELRKLESVKPDTERFPAFEEYLRLSMRRETELFFEHIVREDRSILDFIDADYTFMNERLARFYGVGGVTGPEFRKVSLAGTQRGGVLTQASVLTVSSYATRTSPVLRGKWILDNILNAPPPPPPPDVPNLEDAKAGEAVSVRAQLEVHRANPTCNSCHARLDPLGFGLENFDAVGAWRTLDGKTPVDASGTLPDGRSFKGPGEFKAILKGDRQEFAHCVTEKLLTYALGRGLERYDRRTVKEIAARVAADDYRFSSLALQIVNSLPFRMRRGDQPK